MKFRRTVSERSESNGERAVEGRFDSSLRSSLTVIRLGFTIH
ncbi:MAG: hypothetical protein WC353_06840 [Candidatus Peribacter sp.]